VEGGRSELCTFSYRRNWVSRGRRSRRRSKDGDGEEEEREAGSERQCVGSDESTRKA
jgi:hypothetical protein